MKKFLLYIVCLFLKIACFAQADFTGIAKYKLSTIGSSDARTDSMEIIFGRQHAMLILYLPDSAGVSEKRFIDDFQEKKSYSLDDEKKTYRKDSLRSSMIYSFINTQKYGACNNAICFKYRADSTKLDRSSTSKVECMGSIDYFISPVKNYFFLGVQPVIVDNRIVMDFIVTQTNGIKQRIYVYDINKQEDVENYFSLKNYKQE